MYQCVKKADVNTESLDCNLLCPKWTNKESGVDFNKSCMCKIDCK